MKSPIMLPKEHGAYVMLIAAYLAGLSYASEFSLAAVGVLLGGAGAYLARLPLLRLSKRGRSLRPAVRRRVYVTLSLCAVLFVAGTVFTVVSLEFGALSAMIALAAPAGIISLYLSYARGDRTLPSEVVGTITLASIAPLSWIAATGHFAAESLEIGLACALFFLGGVLHIRWLLGRQRQSRKSKNAVSTPRPELASLAAGAIGYLLWGLSVIPIGLAMAISVAFLRPIVLRGELSRRAKRVGMVELALSCLFIIVVFGGS